MIRFSCPACNASMTAPDRKAGHKFNCLKCGQRLEIPRPPPRNVTMLGRLDEANPPSAGQPSSTSYLAPPPVRGPFPAEQNAPLPTVTEDLQAGLLAVLPASADSPPVEHVSGATGEKRGSRFPLWLLLLLGMLGLLLVVVVCSLLVVGASLPRQSAGNRAVQNDENEVLEMVTAADLLGTYNNNEIAADRYYKGQRVAVQGVVASVATSIFGSSYVTLGTGGDFEIITVQCFFRSLEKDSLAKLGKGEWITVVGKCDGKAINVILKDCRLVDPKGIRVKKR